MTHGLASKRCVIKPVFMIHLAIMARLIRNICVTIRIVIPVLGIILAAPGAQAQAVSAPPVATEAPPGEATSQPNDADVAKPYDAQLVRLAEIIGALHYLHSMCQLQPQVPWRARMQALIQAETPSRRRRSRMIASFNKSYETFRRMYHKCTPAAHTIIVRYLNEGASIALAVRQRYAQ